MLSIIIPSKNEIFLRNTILDVLKNATGDIHIYAAVDGYEPPSEEIVNDPRVTYVRFPGTSFSKKRHNINHIVQVYVKEGYIMALDAHCMVAPGFDTQLIKDHHPGWVQIPRRHRLDAENWCLQPQGDTRPPIDYEYLMFPPILRDKGLHGFKWDARTNARSNIAIDDTLTFQGSCWFMERDWFIERGFMDISYQGWGQEAEEISFETWKNGGRVVTNKNTWYAHLHKGEKYGRMYNLSRRENAKSYDYSYNRWVIEHKDFFIQLIEKFMPLPGWPPNWKELIWTK